MSYTPTEWTSGDIISSEKLNKLEAGVEQAIELPDTTGASDGDVLTLDNGEPTWAAPSGGGGGQRVQINLGQDPDTGDPTISIEGEETLTDEEMNYYLIDAVENNASIYLSYSPLLITPAFINITDIGAGESIISISGLVIMEGVMLVEMTVSCTYIGTAPNGRYEMKGSISPFQLTPYQ